MKFCGKLWTGNINKIKKYCTCMKYTRQIFMAKPFLCSHVATKVEIKEVQKLKQTCSHLQKLSFDKYLFSCRPPSLDEKSNQEIVHCSLKWKIIHRSLKIKIIHRSLKWKIIHHSFKLTHRELFRIKKLFREVSDWIFESNDKIARHFVSTQTQGVFFKCPPQKKNL